ncbi:hypothetical protein HELRODRAFT_159588 [Helobdella robusta]|uniref:Uncharacterized protein n=1 Tax=Helobdella robusta TaxID=6412 RepID=T1EP73_HELRO|nr:hypothetical protein HELRODRAFT_159588 [Helobdella robusta]ESO12994.1 hypothetical protein HELRODRAFT_159588 [Helobdella robusta]
MNNTRNSLASRYTSHLVGMQAGKHITVKHKYNIAISSCLSCTNKPNMSRANVWLYLHRYLKLKIFKSDGLMVMVPGTDVAMTWFKYRLPPVICNPWGSLCRIKWNQVKLKRKN